VVITTPWVLTILTARFLIVPVLEGHFGATVTPYSSKLRCPFHDDKAPSAWHNDYYFKCLACEVKGDAVGLLNRQGGLSFADAYARATALAGEPDESVPKQPARGGRVSGGTRDYRGHSRFGKTGGGG
jgi:DNA primase